MIFFLLTIICPCQGEASRVKKNLKSSTFKAILMAFEVTETLQTKCKTCFRGPRMVLHAHLKKHIITLEDNVNDDDDDDDDDDGRK